MKRFGGFGLASAAMAVLCLLAGCSMAGHKDKLAIGTSDNTSCPQAGRMLAANESAYGQAFLKRFSDRVIYPSEALEAGQSGVVQLCALLGRDGLIHSGRIAAGSGYPMLDGAALLALGTLKHAKEAAPLPRDFAPGQQQLWLVFSVDFKPDRPGVRAQEAQDDRPCKNTGTKEGDLNSGAVTSDEWSGFPAEFSDAVKKHLIYPKLALDDGESGYTLLCVSLDRNSHLLGVAISQSSGSPMLDGASLIALGMLQLNTEIPYIPDRVRQTNDTITFTQEIDWTQAKPLPPPP